MEVRWSAAERGADSSMSDPDPFTRQCPLDSSPWATGSSLLACLSCSGDREEEDDGGRWGWKFDGRRAAADILCPTILRSMSDPDPWREAIASGLQTTGRRGMGACGWGWGWRLAGAILMGYVESTLLSGCRSAPLGVPPRPFRRDA